MTKKLIILLASLVLVVPFLFYGCSGDDGAQGPAGATGPSGPTGPAGPGTVSDESCIVCHGAGNIQNVASAHRIGQSPGTMTVKVDNVTFGAPVDNNVPVTVNFTFAAKNSAGADITSQIDLTTAGTGANVDNLAYLSFYLAKLVPGQAGSPDEWYGYIMTPGATGSSPFRTAVRNGVDNVVFTYNKTTGVGSYKFRTSAVRTSDGYADNAITRAGVQVSGVPVTLFTSDPYFNTSLRRPVANAWLDKVPNGSAVTVFKNDVSTEACNSCHDPLGIHGGGRREIEMCQICHNARIEVASHPMGGGYDNGNLVKLVHGVHQGWNLGSRGSNTAPPPPGGRGIGDFSEVTYPQAINNCTTCHQGPAAADNTYNNFKNRPSRVACGSCHSIANQDPPFNSSFVTPVPAGMVLHSGGVQADGSCNTGGGTGGCHSATAILGYHAAKEGAPTTPNNPTLAAGLKDVRYAMDNVTVDNTNAALVKFQIKIDNVVANLGATGDNVARPSGFSGSPSFLLAYTLEQDGVSAPADYNNKGKTSGQPQSVSIVGLPITAKDNTWTTVKVADAFPAGAKMRAVALQGYFTQTLTPDNVARHTPSVMRPVQGATAAQHDAVRRTVVESGYTAGKTGGCLECHEVFEGHGGNRVNNVQVCVMCHNPNLTSSARVITLDNSTTSKAIIAEFGSDPLTYPEVPNNFKELIHGLHARDIRTTEFVDIRGDGRQALILGDEIAFPGDASHCLKCHVGTTYQNVTVPNALLTTVKITTGNPSETKAQIFGARDTVPNDTDVVNSPAASSCYYCHDSSAAASHFVQMGGDILKARTDALLELPWEVTP